MHMNKFQQDSDITRWKIYRREGTVYIKNIYVLFLILYVVILTGNQ